MQLVKFEMYTSLCLRDGWNCLFLVNYTKCCGDRCGGVMSAFFCFDIALQIRYFPQNTTLLTDSSLIGFLKCCTYQHRDTCQQCQKPFMIHLFSVKHGGALLDWAYESKPQSYFLISGMPPTLLFHHMVISCSPLKWGVWMLICHPPRSKWRAQKQSPLLLLLSWAAASPRPRITLISLALDPSSLVIRSESGPLKRS